MCESEGGTKLQRKRTEKRPETISNGLSWWAGSLGDVSAGGGASVRRGLRAERRQRGGKHQHFGLHEGEIRETCDDFGRLLAQILLLFLLPVKQEETAGVRGQRSTHSPPPQREKHATDKTTDDRRLNTEEHLIFVTINVFMFRTPPTVNKTTDFQI